MDGFEGSLHRAWFWWHWWNQAGLVSENLTWTCGLIWCTCTSIFALFQGLDRNGSTMVNQSSNQMGRTKLPTFRQIRSPNEPHLVGVPPHRHDTFLWQIQSGRNLQKIGNDVLELALGTEKLDDLHRYIAVHRGTCFANLGWVMRVVNCLDFGVNVWW